MVLLQESGVEKVLAEEIIRKCLVLAEKFGTSAVVYQRPFREIDGRALKSARGAGAGAALAGLATCAGMTARATVVDIVAQVFAVAATAGGRRSCAGGSAGATIANRGQVGAGAIATALTGVAGMTA